MIIPNWIETQQLVSTMSPILSHPWKSRFWTQHLRQRSPRRPRQSRYRIRTRSTTGHQTPGECIFIFNNTIFSHVTNALSAKWLRDNHSCVSDQFLAYSIRVQGWGGCDALCGSIAWTPSQASVGPFVTLRNVESLFGLRGKHEYVFYTE